MKDLIQTFCFIIFWVCFFGFFASSIWNFMYFCNPESQFFNEPIIKGCMDNFFNWIFAMCLTFLVVYKE